MIEEPETNNIEGDYLTDQEHLDEKPQLHITLNIKDPENEAPETNLRAKLIVKGLNEIIESTSRKHSLLKKNSGLSPEEIQELLDIAETTEKIISFVRNPDLPPPAKLLEQPSKEQWARDLLQKQKTQQNTLTIDLDSKTIETFIGGDVFSTLSHDVNNRLTPFKGNVQILARSQHLIPAYMAKITKSLKEISKETEGQIITISQELKNKKFHIFVEDFERFFGESIVTTFAKEFKEIGEVEALCFFDSEIPDNAYVEWSPFRARQLFSNIAQNSVKEFIASEHQNPEFTMIVTLSEDKKSLVIYLDDNGKGYPQVYKEKGIIQASEESGNNGYTGTKKVVSHGIGLAKHAGVLEDKYQGKLLAKDPKDEEGNIVKGARTTIILPLHIISSEKQTIFH